MSSGQFLRLEYLNPSESRPEGWQGVLGAAAFATRAPRPQGGGDFPVARVHTPVLSDAHEMMEVWRAGERVQVALTAGYAMRRRRNSSSARRGA